MDKERIIQEFVPGKQVTLAHLIAHPGAELAKKIGVPESGAIGIMTLTPGETAMIAGDLALKAADVHEKPRYLMPCRGIIPSPEKRRRWNLTIVATSIHPGNISAIRAGITP